MGYVEETRIRNVKPWSPILRKWFNNKIMYMFWHLQYVKTQYESQIQIAAQYNECYLQYVVQLFSMMLAWWCEDDISWRMSFTC